MSRDVLEEFVMAPKPRPLIAGNVTTGDRGFDVISCRKVALINNNSPLPRFTLLGKTEPFDVAQKYDFYYVDTGPVNKSKELFDRLPYSGPGWYWRDVWNHSTFMGAPAVRNTGVTRFGH